MIYELEVIETEPIEKSWVVESSGDLDKIMDLAKSYVKKGYTICVGKREE